MNSNDDHNFLRYVQAVPKGRPCHPPASDAPRRVPSRRRPQGDWNPERTSWYVRSPSDRERNVEGVRLGAPGVGWVE